MTAISDAIRRLPYLLGEVTRWPAALYGDRSALIGERVTTYGELDFRIDERASTFRDRGVVRGERWSVTVASNETSIVSLLALSRCGAVVAPVPKNAGDDLAAELRLAGRIDSDGELVRYTRRQAARGTSAQFVDLDPALILRTSGSGGRARGVLFPHHSVLANVFANVAALGYRDDDTTLVLLPLHHAYGLVHQLLCHLTVGATIVLPQQPLLPTRLAHEIARCGATTIATVPPIARFLADALSSGGVTLRRLRLVTIGAARTPAEVLGALRRALPHAQIAVTYGLTEAGPRVATHFVEEEPPVPSRVGQPLPNMAVTVSPAGEIIVRGRSVAETLASGDTIAPLHVLATGDLGTLEDGRLHVHGRVDRSINRGGVTIAAEVIEAALREHPAVTSVVAAASPDALWGEVPVAIVSLREGVSESDLLRFCASRLIREECPVRITIAPALAPNPKETRLLREFAECDG